MGKYCWILLVLVIYTPPPAKAEFHPSERRWTLGYESGVTLRRFFGENWEVYLGGGPNDSLGETHESASRNVDGEFIDQYSEREEETKVEEGHVFLGTGRTLLRDQRFWMAGTLSLKYRWRNYQTSNYSENFFYESNNSQQVIGHRMTTTVYLGIRPAYDITSRITLMLGMGVYFSHETETWDKWAKDEEGPQTKSRFSRDGNNTGLFGYYGIRYISFIYRF